MELQQLRGLRRGLLLLACIGLALLLPEVALLVNLGGLELAALMLLSTLSPWLLRLQRCTAWGRAILAAGRVALARSQWARWQGALLCSSAALIACFGLAQPGLSLLFCSCGLWPQA